MIHICFYSILWTRIVFSWIQEIFTFVPFSKKNPSLRTSNSIPSIRHFPPGFKSVTAVPSLPTRYSKSDAFKNPIGDRIHIGCILTPDNAPFDVGEEYMKADKAEGIYDYVIDADGRGATLTLTGPGRGLIYMEAGPPVNDAALFMIEVNKP